MSKPIPAVQTFMSTSPVTIGQEQTIATASKVMKEHRIRHLPVLHGGRIVGVLSERDVALVEALPDVDPTVVTVEDAMSGAPYTTSPETALDDVAREMAEHKYGCAVVMQDAKVVGVFTTVDACRALADLFATR